MNAKTRKYVLVCTVIVISFLLMGVAGSFSAGEKQAKPPSFTLSASFQNNLVMSQGQFAYITLKSGNTLSGNIKEVKNGWFSTVASHSRCFYPEIKYLAN